MIKLARAVRFWASKISRQEVMDSNYQQLASLLARKYGQRQYRNSNAACLHEIQHHYKVLRPGDCVLDIGAGPDYYWTDLALSMTQDDASSNLVISNDIQSSSRSNRNNPMVVGDFGEEQVRTNIALKLGERKLDSILMDVSPAYTGQLEQDGMEITNLARETITFGSTFLNKGGNFVCKVLDCSSTKLIQQVGSIYFHESFDFRPSVLRPQCPVKYLVMKGFAMNHNLSALKDFISEYKGSAKNRIAVVQKYQGKYNWDPVEMLNRRAKEDILVLRQKGRTYLDIERMFANDPFVKINSIMKKLKNLEAARKQNESAVLEKAINKFTDGQLFPQSEKIPTTREEWIDFLDVMEKEKREEKKKKAGKVSKSQRNLAPLGENQVYLKHETKADEPEEEKLYLQADLEGNFSPIFEETYVDSQIEKISRINPQAASILREKCKKGGKINLEDVFRQDETTQEQVERDLKETADTLRVMTDQQFKKILDRQGYQDEIEQTMLQNDPKARLKFRNK